MELLPSSPPTSLPPSKPTSFSSIHLSPPPSLKDPGAAVSTKKPPPPPPSPRETAMGPQQDPKKASSNGSVATKEKVVRYRECRKNHAANIGGYAVDGCREFMASGEEGTSDALRCAACNCHRSFHKREVETETVVCDCSSISTSRR